MMNYYFVIISEKIKLRYIKCLIVIFVISCTEKVMTEESSSIADVLFLNDTVIICAKNNNEILLSKNGGNSWEAISKCNIDQLTIDEKGTIWGIKSWIGIHEPSTSELYYSNNLGRTWDVSTFNTKVFFPVSIFSDSYQKLKVLTFSNRVYELNENNINKDWIEINSLDTNKLNKLTGLYNDRELKKLNSKFDLTDLSICLDILETNDTSYVVGGGLDGKAYFSMFHNKNHKFRYKMDGIQATGVKKDSNNRIWVFGDAGAFIVSGNSLFKKI